MKTLLASILIFFLLSSCQEQAPTYELSPSEDLYSFTINRVGFVGGTAKGLEKIRLKIAGTEVKVVEVSEDKFSSTLKFSQSLKGEIEFEGLVNSKVVTIAVSSFQVSDGSTHSDDRFRFDLKPPTIAEQKSSLTLWATYYFLPIAKDLDQGYALRDLSSRELGPRVTKRQWCDGALEGSILIEDQNGNRKTYNYAGTSNSNLVNCSAYFNHTPSHKVKFKKAIGEFGDGVRSYKLMPFRSIAVDPRRIPYGSVIYIPAARGTKINLPAGGSAIHDGYFFAADTGGLIKGSHIDVFIGVEKRSPFSWIKSNASGTFKAYLIESSSKKEMFDDIH